MATLIRPASWGQAKPTLGSQINWGHPLAQGMLIFAPLWYGSSAPNDYLYGGGNGVAGAYYGSGFATVPNVAAAGIRLNATPPGHTSESALSFAVRANILGILSSYAGVLNQRVSAYTNGLMIPSPNQLGINWSNKATWQWNGAGFDYNREQLLGGSAAIGRMLTWSASDFATNTSNVPTAPTSLDISANFSVGLDVYNSNRVAYGSYTYAIVWNRWVTADEYEWLNAEPYAFFAPPAIQRFYSIYAGSPAIEKSYNFILPGRLPGTLAAQPNSVSTNLNYIVQASAFIDFNAINVLNASASILLEAFQGVDTYGQAVDGGSPYGPIATFTVNNSGSATISFASGVIPHLTTSGAGDINISESANETVAVVAPGSVTVSEGAVASGDEIAGASLTLNAAIVNQISVPKTATQSLSIVANAVVTTTVNASNTIGFTSGAVNNYNKFDGGTGSISLVSNSAYNSALDTAGGAVVLISASHIGLGNENGIASGSIVLATATASAETNNEGSGALTLNAQATIDEVELEDSMTAFVDLNSASKVTCSNTAPVLIDLQGSSQSAVTADAQSFIDLASPSTLYAIQIPSGGGYYIFNILGVSRGSASVTSSGFISAPNTQATSYAYVIHSGGLGEIDLIATFNVISVGDASYLEITAVNGSPNTKYIIPLPLTVIRQNYLNSALYPILVQQEP